METTTIEAPAKLNLTLDITGVREDGYHFMKMIMQAVDLTDIVTINKNNSEKISVICSNKQLPQDSGNIAYKAAVKFFEYTKLLNTGIEIKIEKNIPFCAGLAGGSADAAAVLVGLNHLFDTKLTQQQLCKIGVNIGADVPFCIQGGTKLAEGIGEILSPIPLLTECYFVIAKPKHGTATQNAFKLYDECMETSTVETENVVAGIVAKNIDYMAKNMSNVLEQVCLTDEMKKIKEKILESDALGSIMTGSGSAVFGVFDSKRKAAKCCETLKLDYEQVFLCKPYSKGATIIE